MTIIQPESEWRLSTAGGVKYRLKERSGVFETEGASATEVVIIRASRLLDFVLESFPVAMELGTGIIAPRPRPMPGTALATKRIAWKSFVDGRPVDPFSVDTTLSDDDHAKTYNGDLELTIEYGTSPHNDDHPDPNNPLTFLEITASASGEYLNSPMRGGAEWQAFGDDAAEEVKELNVPMTVVQPEVEWNVKWSQVPWWFFNQTLMGRLRDKLGKVNNAAMPMFYNAPAETVLFTGYSINSQYTWRSGASGQPPMKLEMKFLEKNFTSDEGVQVTHNHYYRPGHGFRRLKINDKDPHAKDNLTAIFAAST